MILLEFMHACNNLIDGNQGEEGNFKSSISRLLSIIDLPIHSFKETVLIGAAQTMGLVLKETAIVILAGQERRAVRETG